MISVLVPAARGRLHLARGDGPRALACFEACLAMLHPDVWGIGVREAGYLHARSGAAQALLLTGDQDRARALAQAELADAREFGGRRASASRCGLPGWLRTRPAAASRFWPSPWMCCAGARPGWSGPGR